MLLAILAAALPMAVVERPDPLTDIPSVWAVATDGENRLAIGCFEVGDRPIVVLNTERWMLDGSDWTHKRRVTFRFDDGPLDSAEWVMVDDQVAQLENRKEVARFIRSIAESERVRIRARALSLPDIDLDFRYTDAVSALAKVSELCSGAPAEHGDAPSE